ncbi:unnamed protein product, partial [Amoebophrya sp. A120]
CGTTCLLRVWSSNSRAALSSRCTNIPFFGVVFHCALFYNFFSVSCFSSHCYITLSLVRKISPCSFSFVRYRPLPLNIFSLSRPRN